MKECVVKKHSWQDWYSCSMISFPFMVKRWNCCKADCNSCSIAIRRIVYTAFSTKFFSSGAENRCCSNWRLPMYGACSSVTRHRCLREAISCLAGQIRLTFRRRRCFPTGIPTCEAKNGHRSLTHSRTWICITIWRRILRGSNHIFLSTCRCANICYSAYC